MATPIPKNRAPFSLADVVAATGGKVERVGGAAAALGISSDSRAVEPGNVFVALRGDRFDGHDHVPAAVERGATMIVASRSVQAPTASVILVPDTLAALGALALAHRRRWGATGQEPLGHVVAITGSAGKTTTRHATQRLLEALGHAVHASAGNLNNAIGVPMSLLGLEDRHQVAVIEIGMNRPGEIAHATKITQPHIGVVTLVSEAHTEGVGDLWGVLREKGDLLAGLYRWGAAVANADDDGARACLLRSPARRHVRYGTRGVEVRLVDRRAQGLGGSDLTIELRPPFGDAHVVQARVPLLGVAGTSAALAAVAVASQIHGSFASDPGRLVSALEALGGGEAGRLSARERADGTVVIDDAYNANPASMVASIDAAGEIARSLGKRLVLVLGEMRELGADAQDKHESVGRHAAAAGIAVLICVAGSAAHIGRAAELAGAAGVTFVPDADAALAALGLALLPGDVVLVKGSNSIGLSRVATAVIER